MASDKLSFIPKTSSSGASQTSYKKAGLGPMSKSSVFLFIISLAILGGAFLYKNAIIRQIDSLTVSLTRAKAAFDPVLISEMEKLTVSLIVAEDLIAEHRFQSNIFDALEDLTHPDLRFSSLSYSYDLLKGGVKIDLTGQSKSYIALAQQAEIFGDSNKIESFTFSGLSLDETGDISFSLDLIFNPLILAK